MLLLLLAVAVPALVVPAKVTDVTVFNDRARIVRSATVELSGSKLVELAILPDSVDPGSIRLEAKHAEVRQVDLGHVDESEFPAGPAKLLLEKLEKLDDQLTAAGRERLEHLGQLALLRKIHPQLAEAEAMKPAPKLNASGWAQSLGFVDGGVEREQARVRELDQKLIDLNLEREKLAAEAQRIGAVQRRSGLRVTALLAGEGTAQVTLTYLVGGARWTPAYDLTYLPAQERVQLSLSGMVSQQSGEEWDEAALTLSTAVPGVATQLPKLLTWKIGEKERFVPLSHAQKPPAPPPPPPRAMAPFKGPALPDSKAQGDELRQALLSRAASPPSLPEPPSDEESDADQAGGVTVSGAGRGGVVGIIGSKGAGAAHGAIRLGSVNEPPAAADSGYAYNQPPAAPPPPPAMASRPPSVQAERATRKSAASAPSARSEAYVVTLNGAGAPDSAYVINGKSVSDPGVSLQVGLAPPPAYRPPSFGPDAPATLAGGFDLAFTSPRPATVPSGGAARRVPLLTESWPVTTERVIFPAIAPEAYLVATLKNPSARTLPGGAADLFVGDDPAGTARLQLVAPGEQVTLPLGLDRAIKPVRNVTQVQAEKGVFSKDDVTEYVVTIEVANPYPQPIPLRIVDQVPLPGDKNGEVNLLRSSPEVKRNPDTGQVEWHVQVPASGKTLVTFAYELKRPKGYKVRQ